jgi:hypothetical protein
MRVGSLLVIATVAAGCSSSPQNSVGSSEHADTSASTADASTAGASWRDGLPPAPFELSKLFKVHCRYDTSFPVNPDLEPFSSEEDRETELTISADDDQGEVRIVKPYDTTGMGYDGAVGPDGTWSKSYSNNIKSGVSGSVLGRTATVSTWDVGGSGTGLVTANCYGAVTFTF